jgi:hypothetical protein
MQHQRAAVVISLDSLRIGADYESVPEYITAPTEAAVELFSAVELAPSAKSKKPTGARSAGAASASSAVSHSTSEPLLLSAVAINVWLDGFRVRLARHSPLELHVPVAPQLQLDLTVHSWTKSLAESDGDLDSIVYIEPVSLKASFPTRYRAAPQRVNCASHDLTLDARRHFEFSGSSFAVCLTHCFRDEMVASKHFQPENARIRLDCASLHLSISPAHVRSLELLFSRFSVSTDARRSVVSRSTSVAHSDVASSSVSALADQVNKLPESVRSAVHVHAIINITPHLTLFHCFYSCYPDCGCICQDPA